MLERICSNLGPEPRFKAYLITNTATGQQYIGVTERSLKSRWRQHLQSAKSGDYGYLLHDEIRRYGPDTFDFQFIACAATRSDLGELEKLLVAQYQTVENGYNQTRGGKAGEMVGKAVTVNGKTFISLNAASRHHGVEEYLVHQRMRVQGWTLEQALGVAPAPRRTHKGRAIEADGCSYPTIRAAAEAHNITESALATRLALGWSTDQALGRAPPPKRVPAGVSLVIGGVQFKTIAEAARRFGVPSGTVRKRLRLSWSPEQAVGIHPPPARHRTFGNEHALALQGSAYSSVKAAARALGKNYGTVAGRLQLGWSVEQAFDLAPPPPPSGKKNGVEVTVSGRVFASHSDAANAHGIAPQQFLKRLKLGWTTEQALGVEPRPPARGNNRKRVTVKGQPFPSIREAARYFGITPSAVAQRMRTGMSLEDALSKPSRTKK
ncbi:NUMOD1 domain-containing DNA-binding protein [Zeimonas arvi]|uniref:NUMOD1 domain-containing DNA-binding protein n=1 Tax=Zeimonas arvi TaxID=2498847 RepID=UPI001650C56F|nr:NUMOD1 domain-containing DNA-binding protein [Zeimonas arvi]